MTSDIFTSQLLRRAGNNALNDNPVAADIQMTVAGSDFLWMVFSVMSATTLGIGIWSAVSIPRGQRVFHHLSMMITATASIAYFCMASDLGSTPIAVEFGQRAISGDAGIVTRSIWYVRYIDWTITTPLLLLELLLVSGLPLSEIVITIFADEVMIISGLVGALVKSQYKFGLFAIGCFAMLFVFYQLYFPGRQSTQALGSDFSRSYLVGASILSFLWFLYPIAWGLCEGGNVVGVNGEMFFYGILDLCAKPAFALVHLITLSKVDLGALQLKSGKYSDFASESQNANTRCQNHKISPYASIATATREDPTTTTKTGETGAGDSGVMRVV